MRRRDAIKGIAGIPIGLGLAGSTKAGIKNTKSSSSTEEWMKEARIMYEDFGRKKTSTESAGGEVEFRTPSVLYEGVKNRQEKRDLFPPDNYKIFQDLGVEPLINCMGTFTIIGGSLERPAVRDAMNRGAHAFVQYDELAHGIGQRLSELTGAEWGMVSSGCAACMKQATLACVTGGNPEKLIRVPHLAGLEKTEVIIPRHSRNTYDHSIRNVGVTIVTVDSPEELELAINKKTAMIYMMTPKASEPGQPLSVENIVRIAKPHKVPVLVDAAAEDLTIPITHLERGADLVAYSGGKAFCGPQCSGLLLGRRDLVEAAWYSAAPHHGPSRDNKVGREEMLGALAAIKAWIDFDHKNQKETWLSYLNTVGNRVAKIKGVTTELGHLEVRSLSELNNNSPALMISWDPVELNLTGEEVAEEVGRNKPRIALSFGNNPKTGNTLIRITSGQMQPGEDKVVAERLYSILSKKYPVKPGLKSPAEDLSGRWDVKINYYGSEGHHTWFIEQKENWLMGINRSDLSSWDMSGMVDGSEVKIRCRPGILGDGQLSYTFTGKIENGEIKGSVYLVEYGTAKFMAKRSIRDMDRSQITVPGGPPLAT